MKLQTMLLPTGEFIFVISGLPDEGQITQEDAEAFMESTGAVGLLTAPVNIEVVDALIDELAVRREHDDIDSADESDYFDTDGEFWSQYTQESPEKPADFASVAEVSSTGKAELVFQNTRPTSEEFAEIARDVTKRVVSEGMVFVGPEEVEKFERLFQGGAEVSPAGLVDGGPRGPENDTVATGELTAVVGRFVPQVGDTVLVTGRSYFGADRIGRTGTVVENALNNTPEGHVLVEIPDLDDSGSPFSIFYSTDNIEVQPAAPEAAWEPQVGELVRIDRVNGWGPNTTTMPNPHHGLSGRFVKTLDFTNSDSGQETIYVVKGGYTGGEIHCVEISPLEDDGDDDNDYEDEDY